MEQTLARRFLAQSLFSASQLFLEFWQCAVLNLRGGVEIVAPLSLLELELGLFDLAVDHTHGIDRRLLVLPLSFEFAGLLLEIRQILLDFFQPFARGWVLFLLARVLFDFELLGL